MRLPTELINLICDYIGDGKYLHFDKKLYCSFRIDSEHEKYNDIRDLYRNCIINSHYDKPEIVWSGGTSFIMGIEGGRFYGRTSGGDLPVGHREKML